jgi:hypothetical protein
MLGSNQQSQGPLYILKPVSKDKDKKSVKPHFQISKSVDGKWQVQDDKSINTVTGNLVRIESVEEEYEGDKYHRARIYLRDGEDGYMIPCRLNIASRSLLNSLFSLEDFKGVTIKYYLTKTGYDAFYVSQGENKVSWKFESDQLPKAEEFSFKGKVMRDFGDMDNFFVEQIKVLNGRITGSKEEAKEEVKEESQVKEDSDVPAKKARGSKKVVEETEDDQVPF